MTESTIHDLKQLFHRIVPSIDSIKFISSIYPALLNNHIQEKYYKEVRNKIPIVQLVQ